MDSFVAIDLGRDAIRSCLMIGGPILAVSLMIGVGVGILQTMTQVQDQTVSFVPKLIGIVLAIGLALPWLAAKMVDYTEESLATPITHRMGDPTARSITQPASFKKEADRSTDSLSADSLSIGSGGILRLENRIEQVRPNHSEKQNAPTDSDSSLDSADSSDSIQPDDSPFRMPHYRFSRLPKTDQEL